MNPTGKRPQLCVALEAAPGAESVARVKAALESVPLAVLVIAARGGMDPAAVRGLVQEAQRRGIAALIENDAELARTVGADGVHLAASPDVTGAYSAARAILGPQAIVGADAGGSRHDAMTIAEAGADYVAFGIPANAAERAEAEADRLDLVLWWAEIFEVPVVAFDVVTAEEARELAGTGADFIALRIPAKLSASEVGGWIAEVAAADKLAAPT